MSQNHGEQSAKDLIIAQLRHELTELRERSAQVSELTEKLTNTEFSLQLVTNEKQAAERENTFKMEQNLKVISQLRSEVDLLSRKLVTMPLDLANPIWVGDSPVDLDHHIRRLQLPKPGSQVQLEAAVATLHEGMMDRDRPLWEFVVIEGLHDGSVAFYSRIHHAALDGQGGVALAQAILDTSATPRKVEGAGEQHAPGLPPSTAKMLSAAFRNTVAQYSRIVKAVPDALKLAGAAGAGLLSSSEAKRAGAPSEQGTGLGHLVDFKPGDSLQKVAKSLLKKIPGGIALGPRTALNMAISGERAFVGVELPLEEAKLLAKHFDVKLNDIVLAVCAGALRRYFATNKSALAKAMIGGVPASLRIPGDTSQSNQVTMMLIGMATNIADVRKRLAAIIAASTKAKMLTGSMKSLIPMDLPSLGIPWLMSVITPLYRTAVASNKIPVVANLVVSNVPGPQVPLYLAGAELKTYYPVSIVTHGLALNITIQSYAGKLYYGLIACKQVVPDLDRFGRDLMAAHHELVALMRADLAKSTVGATRKTPEGPAAKARKKVVAKTAAKAATARKSKPVAKPKTRTAARPAAGRGAKVTVKTAPKVRKKTATKVAVKGKSGTASTKKKRA